MLFAGNFGRAAQTQTLRTADDVHRQATFVELPAHHPSGTAGGRAVVPVTGRPVRRARPRTRESLGLGVHAGRSRLAHRAPARQSPNVDVPVRSPGQRSAGRRLCVAHRFPGIETHRARRITADHAVCPTPRTVRHHFRVVTILAERSDDHRVRKTVRHTVNAPNPKRPASGNVRLPVDHLLVLACPVDRPAGQQYHSVTNSPRVFAKFVGIRKRVPSTMCVDHDSFRCGIAQGHTKGSNRQTN